MKENKAILFCRNIFSFILLLLICNLLTAQIVTPSSRQIFYTPKKASQYPGIFGNEKRFIQNIGQYGDTIPGYGNLGKIQYGFEGFDMPVLFTSKGLVYLQRKITRKEKDKGDRKGGHPEEEWEDNQVTDRVITMEWKNANPNAQIIAEDAAEGFYTYGMLHEKAAAYKKLLYKNLYPGIDVEYYFTDNSKKGFEYKVIIQPGANANLLQMQYGGDVTDMKKNAAGNLNVYSDLGSISETAPYSFYQDEKNKRISTPFSVNKKQVHFDWPTNIDKKRTLVIDPFVTASNNLTGSNSGKAKDIDFDYDGNIYITGGGSLGSHSLAKYNAAGVLQWTFSGSLTIPSWTFGPYYGGWVVEKTTGNVYLGQGFNYTQGFIVIRINTNGLYDNYITTGNPSFRENWKMYWNCNSGNPQIIIAGGGTNSNINLGYCSPPSTVLSASNITGISPTAFQDMSDMIIDPVTNSMYTIYASGSVPALNNAIYKHDQPYSSGTIAWSTKSGYSVMKEANNRPYLSLALIDNSTNTLAINPSYLFYWDGKNLKAFDKTTGAGVGTPLTTANTALMQGGIIADDCNNIFVGSTNGTIKVYQFNGATFDDAIAPDISIPGFSTSSVYDLAFDESKKLLYASGNGFVASFDVSAYCISTVFTLNVAADCGTATATAILSPTPPVGSTVTYALYIGGIQIASNNTGVFSNLTPDTTYTVIATINRACSGTQTSTNFILPGPTISIIQTNTTCGNNTGSITASGSGGTAPYTYSIDGTNFQSSGTFSGLAAGAYTITCMDVGGCHNAVTTIILNTDGPDISNLNSETNCSINNGTITVNATGGTPPYLYSSDNGVSFHSNNFFTGLADGQYKIVVRDSNNCTNTAIVNITSSSGPSIIAVPATATCGNSNGKITAFGTGGVAPLEYSINSNVFQSSNVFNNVAPNDYTVTVKDANGCASSTTVTVESTESPGVSVSATNALCNNSNGTITATGTGGLAPLQYSINGTTFQTSNTFTGLAAGNYTVTVKDAVGCIGIANVVIGSTNGPSVLASATSSSCNSSNGSITITATGTPTFYYSIDGSSYQASNSFTGITAGNYIALAKDGNGCIGATSITVNNIAGPTISLVATPSSCTATDGSITATATGGTAPIQYSIDGTNFQPSNIFSGLTSGVYTVTISDANNCLETASITVPNASGLTLNESTVSATCNSNTSDGIITANTSGGIAPLQYSLDGTNYQSSNIFSAVAPGDYTIYVKDANNCLVSSNTTVESYVVLEISTDFYNATCTTSSGIIIAEGFGGTEPYQYSKDGTTYQISGTFINIAAGTYPVTVKDANGCLASENVTISNIGSGPGITSFTVSKRDNYPCIGEEDFTGRIYNQKVNGVTCSTCTYSLDFGTFVPDASPLFTGLTEGTYYVTAMDTNGCTKTITVTINQAAIATASLLSVKGTDCLSDTGSIQIKGNNAGGEDYFASITGIGGPWVMFSNTYTFTGLSAGVYMIIITDHRGFIEGDAEDNIPDNPGDCLDTLYVTVPSTNGPSVSATKTDVTCSLSDGTITVLASGGTAPYLYDINGWGYQSDTIFTDLDAGTYQVNVMDDDGCVNSTLVTISDAGVPDISAEATMANCNLSSGTITAVGLGGTAPLEYSIDGFNFQSSSSFSSLAAGSYSVYVRDSNGCSNYIDIDVENNSLPEVTSYVVPATCNNDDGAIVATGSGGTAPYKFSIDGSTFQSSKIFSGLSAGVYTVTIKDADNCTTTSGISINNLSGPTISSNITAASCNSSNGAITLTAGSGTSPYTYSDDGTNFQTGNTFTDLASGNYIVAVKDTNGCVASKTVLVENNSGPQELTVNVENATCGLSNGYLEANTVGGTVPLQYSLDGINFQTDQYFTNLSADSFTVTVKDNKGCIKTTSAILVNLDGATLTASSASASCGVMDGSITATALNGSVPLLYSIDGLTFQSSNIFTDLSAGLYTVTVQDDNGCVDTTDVTVNSIAGDIASSATVVPESCGNNTGSITASASGGNPPYLYSIDGINFQSSNVFNGLGAGYYTITIKDANNCTDTTGITVTSTSIGGITGVWTGNVSTDWFDCRNWGNGIVPDNSIDISIPGNASNLAEIDPLSPFAPPYSGIARSKNIVIDSNEVTFQANAILITVGDLTIQNTGMVDMTAGGTNTSNCDIELSGNWINTVGTSGFNTGLGKLSMLGTSGLQTINTTGVSETIYDLTINNADGVTLLKDVNVAHTLTLTNGIVNTDASPNGLLTLDTAATNPVAGSPGLSSFVNGPMAKNSNTTVEFEFPIGKKLPSISYRPCSIVPTATGLTTFTSEYMPGSNIPYYANWIGPSLFGLVNTEYWQIDRSTDGTPSPARVGLNYINPGTGFPNWSLTDPCGTCPVAVVHLNSSNYWEITGTASTLSTSAPYIESRLYSSNGPLYSTVWNSFSPFTSGFIDFIILANDLLKFTGQLSNDDGLLNWEVANSANIESFQVQHSNDGIHFENLGKVSANGQRYYSYTHESLSNGPHYYRLWIKEVNGKSSFSQVVLIYAGKPQTYVIGLGQSIVKNEVTAFIYSASRQSIRAFISDVTGREIRSQKKMLFEGKNQFPLNTQYLAQGMYFITLYTDDGVKKTLQFMKE